MRKEARKKAVQARLAKSGTNAGSPMLHPDRDYAKESDGAKKKLAYRRELAKKNYSLHKAGKTHVGDGRDVIHPKMSPGNAGKNRSKGARKQRRKENAG